MYLSGNEAAIIAELWDGSLLDEWAISQPGTAERSEATARMTAPKAWRFDGEMAEIAASLAAHDLPTGIGDAASEVFGPMADFKGDDDATLDAMLDVLLGHPPLLNSHCLIHRHGQTLRS